MCSANNVGHIIKRKEGKYIKQLEMDGALYMDGWQSFQRINVVEAYDMRLAMAMVCDTALVEAKCRPNRTSE